MAQVIIFTNENGNVSVCPPSGEIPIEEVLVKDCPAGATIVDESILPQDHTYFNAWRLVGGAVILDEEAARQVALNDLNVWAAHTATQRATNAAIGIAPVLNDPSFIAVLDQGRAALATAETLDEMTQIVQQTEQAASGT